MSNSAQSPRGVFSFIGSLLTSAWAPRSPPPHLLGGTPDARARPSTGATRCWRHTAESSGRFLRAPAPCPPAPSGGAAARWRRCPAAGAGLLHGPEVGLGPLPSRLGLGSRLLLALQEGEALQQRRVAPGKFIKQHLVAERSGRRRLLREGTARAEEASQQQPCEYCSSSLPPWEILATSRSGPPPCGPTPGASLQRPHCGRAP